MNNFQSILVKLEAFIKKFYINELIKGCLLFFTIGLLYFIFTLFVESLLWLNPLGRTLLFYIFLLVEVFLITFYIIIPILKIVGVKRGLNSFEASKLIGQHFPEINDKLLNMLQLEQVNQGSELIQASIDQKSNELIPIPFIKAIDFSKNRKYIKYALIPVLIVGLIYVTDNISFFNESFTRVVHYKEQYVQPAPFLFKINNASLNVVEGKPLLLHVVMVGSTIPEDVKIYFNDENYLLENKGNGNFEFLFNSVKKSFDFYLEANGFESINYQVNVISTPVISDLKMVLQYPSYTGKSNEVVVNTGNAVVPEGTKITWQINAVQTDEIDFEIVGESKIEFSHPTDKLFSFSKVVKNSINYNISTSNKSLKNYELLKFSVSVVGDEFPKINVKSNIDSITRGPVQFVGQVTDDFGIQNLQIVYYDVKSPQTLKSKIVPITKGTFSDFFYAFPNEVPLDEGVNYDLYFEVFDNDAVNGSKRTKSSVFSYYNKSLNEINEEILKEQKENLNSLSKDLLKNKELNKSLEKLSNELQKKADVNWNDAKKIEEFLKRQSQYEKMIDAQTKKIENNLKEFPVENSNKEKKEELQKRIDETKKLEENKKLLEELKTLSEKLNKDELVDKLKDITSKSNQREQSLERILELTKRFYVEQKQQQLNAKIQKLGEKQDEVSNVKNEENTSKKQQELNKDFDDIQKEFKNLEKENNDLKRPLKMPDLSDEKKEIDDDMDKALEDLRNDKKESAKKSQKSAAKKLKKMGDSLEKSMEASEGESMDEDIDDLRKIVENLIKFSFQQEDLMNEISKISGGHPSFSKNLKQQNVLKEYFEHIDDSLYVLSLRMVKMGGEIQNEVSKVHFNIGEAISNLAESNIEQGISNQHFVITSSNNLANSLSNILENLMNASPSMGKGKGKQEFGLPDIIKKQGELKDKVEEGMEKEGSKGKDKQNGKGSEGNEGMNEELYEVYKQQMQLREALNKLLDSGKEGEKGTGKSEALKKMEDLENELLKKGFTQDVVKKMQELNYEFLKLEKAKKEQNIDDQRKSNNSSLDFNNRTIDTLKMQNRYFNNIEILNRQSLPLRIIYKRKVEDYFKTE